MYYKPNDVVYVPAQDKIGIVADPKWIWYKRPEAIVENDWEQHGEYAWINYNLYQYSELVKIGRL